VNFIEVFDCFTKITKQFTFMLADSPIDDFFVGSRTNGQAFDQPTVAFDGVTFMVLDREVIAGRFASKSRRPVHLRRIITWMGALRFVRAIRSKAFSNSSLPSIVIPQTVEIIGSVCFSDCKSLSSVSIESGSLLRRIESSAFSFSSLSSITIPRTVEILGSVCFSSCKSLSSVSVESGPLLRRIKSYAFSKSSLTSIVIPQTVEIVRGSAFSNCERLLISVEEGSEHLAVDGYFLQSFDRSILIRYFGREDIVCIPRTVGAIGSSCFRGCKSLSSVLIESGSLLRKIESQAFLCPKLKSVCLLVDVQSIAVNAFHLFCKVSRE
jgi:predicted transcriptional regulator